MARNEGSAAGSNRGNSGAGSSGNARELPPQLGRYRVKQKLGGGGMGSVYLVENTELEREEALKVPHFGDGTDTELLERFLREARSAAKLDHANLCPIYDAGVQDGFYYLTMRYLKGKLLSDYSGQAQPTRKTVEIVTKLAQALETAHSKGVIHRDLKPSNIMMVAGVGPVVMDFGLAKQVQQADSKLTQSGSMLGTPAYMPPEQVNGELDQMGPPSDVYSLGVILYELLTGRLPFEGTMASIFGKILYAEPPLPSAIVPGLNPTLDGFCRKAMAKSVSERYPSMKAFAAVLIEYLKAMPANEGLGSLIPNAVDNTDVFQAQTVAPSPRPAPRADLFQAQTLAPQSRSSMPLPTIGPLAGRDSSGLLATVAAGPRGQDVQEETRQGASSGTKLVRVLVLTGVVGALAGVGWMMLPESNTPKPTPKLLAKAPTPKVEPPASAKKKVGGSQPKATPNRRPIVPVPAPVMTPAKRRPGFPKAAEPIVPKKEEPKAEEPIPPGNLSGFVSLFSGDNFAGWTVDGGRGEAWKADSGVIEARGQGYPTRNYLLTDRDYSDFILRLEFNLEKGAGSGIAIRARQGEQVPTQGGGRIVDHPLFKLIESPGREQTGTTHWVVNSMNVSPDSTAALKPSGSWNLLELEVRGSTMRAWVNEKLVLDTTIVPTSRFPDGTVPGLNRNKGRIGLQRHTGTVRFRNIALKELAAAPNPVAKADDPATKAAKSLQFGELLEQQGKPDQALRLYKEIVHDFPDTPAALKAKENIAALTAKARRK
jgi:serine/threonine protein kinase